jgi:adenylate cyclase
MPKKLRNLSTFLTAVLSRRIVLWVFFSVIAIETIIFFPSLRNRERELLTQLKTVSTAKIEVMMKTAPENDSCWTRSSSARRCIDPTERA